MLEWDAEQWIKAEEASLHPCLAEDGDKETVADDAVDKAENRPFSALEEPTQRIDSEHYRGLIKQMH
jgi:hypothetical protein